MQKLLLLFSLIIWTNISFGQKEYNLKDILPPSPEASAFVKYGTYKVGTYTGRPDISVPVYDIKTSNFSIPISINYDATGIRVNESSSWVGTNWSLSAGGMIACVVMGQPDRLTGTSLDVVPPRASDIIDNSSNTNYLQALVEHTVPNPSLYNDSEPDKYYYSFNGRSGSFVLDRNRNVVQIPKTSLQITVYGTTGFKIVDEAGIVYVFNNKEITATNPSGTSGIYPYASANNASSPSGFTNATTGYYLSEMISNNGLEHVYFTYENEETTTKDETYSETFGDKFDQLPLVYPTQFHHTYQWIGIRRVITNPRIKTISFINGKVEFARVWGRQDDGIGSSRLDEIKIYRGTSASGYFLLKSFKLNQSYYYSTQSYGLYSAYPNETVDRYRLRLDNIVLKNASGIEISRYSFSYNTTELPPKTSYSQDMYGYYNGKTNTTLVPQSYAIDGSSNPVSIGGADRSSDETYMKAGILEKITYPTGGFTTFELESHRIAGATYPVTEFFQSYAHGQTSSNIVVNSFTTPASIINLTGHLTITIGPYGPSDPVPFLKIKNMTTGVEQTYTSPDRTNFFSTNVSYNFSASTTYQITASSYVNQQYGFAQIYAYYNKEVTDPNISTVFGGLRVKSIKNYTSASTLASQELYKYGTNEDGNGSYVGIGPGPKSVGRALHLYYAGEGYLCGESWGYQEEFGSGYLYSPLLVYGSPIVYGEVVKYYGTASSNSGKTIFRYGDGSPLSVTVMPMPSGQELANQQGFFVIADTWKKGLLKKQEDYRRNSNGTYSIVKEIENSYNITDTIATYGLVARTKFDRVLVGCNIVRFSDYAFAEYPVKTGYVQLTQSSEKMYNPGTADYAQLIKSNIYDNVYKDIVVKTSSSNSQQLIIEKETKFPFHKAQLLTSITSGESTAIDNMLAKNMLFPIEEISRSGSVQVGLKKTSFEYVNSNTIAAVNVKSQVKSNPVETRLLFTKYDANGNLTEQKKSDNLITSYLWGYGGTLPVAQVVGADYTTVSGLISPSVLSDPNPSASALRTQLDAIRQYYANSNVQVTTYTYAPLIGITSVTDPNNKTNYYEYDAAGRLSLIRDQDNNIVKKYCYNYFGQQEDCSVYTSTNQSGNFYSQNCGSQTPLAYYVNIPDGMFTSTISVADANTQAQQYGQAQANLYGACSAPLTTVFASNNTSNTYYLTFWNNSTGQNYNYTVYPWSTPSASIPVGTYTVTVSDSGSGSYALIDVMGYSTYGMFQYVSNLSIGSGYNNIYMVY